MATPQKGTPIPFAPPLIGEALIEIETMSDTYREISRLSRASQLRVLEWVGARLEHDWKVHRAAQDEAGRDRSYMDELIDRLEGRDDEPGPVDGLG